MIDPKKLEELKRDPFIEVNFPDALNTMAALWKIAEAAQTVSRDHQIDHACYCVLCKTLGELSL